MALTKELEALSPKIAEICQARPAPTSDTNYCIASMSKLTLCITITVILFAGIYLEINKLGGRDGSLQIQIYIEFPLDVVMIRLIAWSGSLIQKSQKARSFGSLVLKVTICGWLISTLVSSCEE